MPRTAAVISPTSIGHGARSFLTQRNFLEREHVAKATCPATAGIALEISSGCCLRQLQRAPFRRHPLRLVLYILSLPFLSI